jgi:cytochrome c oxidase accessory protein FixG
MRPASAGDCIDCGLCVLTCPTGIDIRDGLQMECIHCTQCMDACDSVMARIGKPRGLIRYGSSEELAGRATSRFRVRIAVYPVVLAVCAGLLAWGLATRTDAEVTLLRGLGAPYTSGAGGTVVNQVRLRITNRAEQPRAFHIAVAGAPEARLIAPINPLAVAPEGMNITSVFVILPRTAFHAGECRINLTLSDAKGWSASYPYRLVGPEDIGGAP